MGKSPHAKECYAWSLYIPFFVLWVLSLKPLAHLPPRFSAESKHLQFMFSVPTNHYIKYDVQKEVIKLMVGIFGHIPSINAARVYNQ